MPSLYYRSGTSTGGLETRIGDALRDIAARFAIARHDLKQEPCPPVAGIEWDPRDMPESPTGWKLVMTSGGPEWRHVEEEKGLNAVELMETECLTSTPIRILEWLRALRVAIEDLEKQVEDHKAENARMEANWAERHRHDLAEIWAECARILAVE